MGIYNAYLKSESNGITELTAELLRAGAKRLVAEVEAAFTEGQDEGVGIEVDTVALAKAANIACGMFCASAMLLSVWFNKVKMEALKTGDARFMSLSEAVSKGGKWDVSGLREAADVSRKACAGLMAYAEAAEMAENKKN